MSANISTTIEETSSAEVSLDVASEIKYLDPELESVMDQAEEVAQPVTEEELREPDLPRRKIMALAIPWWLMIIIGTMLGVGLHWTLRGLGNSWFWSERLVYFLSLASLLLLIILSSWLLARQEADALRIYIINMSIGLLAGIIISVMLFLDHVVFWTFFNLIVQPLNALLLATLGSWLGVILFVNKKITSN